MPLARGWAEYALRSMAECSAKERERARHIFYMGYVLSLRDVAPILDDTPALHEFLAMVSAELAEQVQHKPKRRRQPAFR